MAKDPADRYESCQELVRELELALGMPAPVSGPGGRHARDSGEVATLRADVTSDAPPVQPGTVTEGMLGGSQHPSFPSRPFVRFPARADAWSETAPPADDEPEVDDYPQADQGDDGGYDRDGGEPVAPPARRRRWRLLALVAAAAVLVAVAGVLLRASFQSESYRTYTSADTLVPFRLDHPSSWGAVVGPASDVVLGPNPTPANQLFFNKGTPEAWASTTATVRAGSPQDAWLYVYTSASTFDTSDVKALQDSIAPLLPATTPFDSVYREVSVAGASADELEAVTSDPQDPQTRLRVLVDVVQPPGAGGAVLLAFFAPPDTFENHRSTFERIRDSLTIGP
jgi:hypothetical protein